MKTKIAAIFISILAISITSCDSNGLYNLKGEGPIVTNISEISSIEGIILEIPATVYITKGQTDGVKIDAQQNIYDNIQILVEDKVLKLKFKKNVSKSDELKVYINMEQLKEASVAGSGNVLSEDDLDTDQSLTINISGSGNVDIKADAPEVAIAISGSGDVKLRTVTQKLSNSISGSGNIMLAGNCTGLMATAISGSGNISAYDFETKNCTVGTSGAGNAKVFVKSALDVQISGSGNVYYKGNPLMDVQISGSGSVINAN